MDDLERTSESPALSQMKPQTARMEMLDAVSAIRLAEGMVGSRVAENDASADGVLGACREAAERGERVTAILRAEALASAREAMRAIAQRRLGLVIHAIGGHGGEELSALVDVGWGVLCSSGPEDSFDLALLARRAAEDSGVPFVVVHALAHGTDAGRAVAMIAIPHEKACRAFAGVSRLRARHDPAHPSLAPMGDRAFTERVPFALGSAFREYGEVSGRRHDVFDKVPLGEPPLVLVGMGPVGDALFHAVSELRAHGYDVGAIHVTSLRPFPGARLVKALARALAVTVLEPADEPLAHGGLLARELKSAFTDALTWAPGFPGIGRIPKLFVGVTGSSFDIGDLAAICENMLADERGRRSFSFADADHALPRVETARGAGLCAMRFVLDDQAVADVALAATAAALAETLGLRTHAIVSSRSGAMIVDFSATREHARGGMARRGPRLVLASDRGATTPDAADRLAPGGVLGVVSAIEGGALSDAARAIAREKRVRIIPLVGGDAKMSAAHGIAAACAGAAVAGAARFHRTAVDSAHVARAVATFFGSKNFEHADVAADRARRAYEATHEALVAADSPSESGDPARHVPHA